MDISRHRYFYDRIAENEMNDRNRDEIRRRMIPFPYIDSVMVRQNSDSVSGHDYIYNYVYSLPVTDGMKKLRVRLESIVEAAAHGGLPPRTRCSSLWPRLATWLTVPLWTNMS